MTFAASVKIVCERTAVFAIPPKAAGGRSPSGSCVRASRSNVTVTAAKIVKSEIVESRIVRIRVGNISDRYRGPELQYARLSYGEHMEEDQYARRAGVRLTS